MFYVGLKEKKPWYPIIKACYYTFWNQELFVWHIYSEPINKVWLWWRRRKRGKKEKYKEKRKKNIVRIAKSCTENISLVVKVLSCFYLNMSLLLLSLLLLSLMSLLLWSLLLLSLLSLLLPSQFEFFSFFFFFTIWVFEFCHKMSFQVWSQFEFLSFVTILVF